MDAVRELWGKWVNAVTVRGFIFVAAGGTVLAFPDASTFLIRIVLAGALIAYGFMELWGAFRSDAAGWQDYVFPFIWVGFGVFTLACVQQRCSPATAEPWVPSTWKVTRSSRRTRTHQELLIWATMPPSSSKVA